MTASGRRRLKDEVAGWNRLAGAIATALATTPDEVRDARTPPLSRPGLFGRRHFEGMSDELQFHIDAVTEDLIRSGIPRDEAVRRARSTRHTQPR